MMNETFVCRLDALTTEQQRRRRALAEALREAAEEARELPNGYALRFAADPQRILELAEFMALERACCPFFNFELALESDGGPLWLRLTGRPGVKEFLRAQFLPR